MMSSNLLHVDLVVCQSFHKLVIDLTSPSFCVCLSVSVYHKDNASYEFQFKQESTSDSVRELGSHPVTSSISQDLGVSIITGSMIHQTVYLLNMCIVMTANQVHAPSQTNIQTDG